MPRPLFNLQSTVSSLRASLLVALVTLVALTLAYQVRSRVAVDVGGKFDQPFVVRFQDQEDDGEQTYRWTRDRSWIELEGTGVPAPWVLRLRANGYRPDRAAHVALAMNETTVEEFDTNGGWSVYTIRGTQPPDAWSGNNTIRLINDTFVPSEEIAGNVDPRKLGIAIDRLELVSERSGAVVGNDDYWVALRAPVIPPFALLLSWAFSFSLLYTTARGIGLPRRAINFAFALFILALAFAFAFARLYVGFYTAPFLNLAIAIALLAVVLTWLAPRVYARLGLELTPRAWAGLGGIILASVGLKWGGMWYTQFHSSDLLFHAHRLEFVTRGNLFFTSQLPDAAQRVVPYPPALYVFLTPLISLFDDYSSLLLIANVLADALAVCAIYYAACKLFADARVGLAAAFLFAFNPVSFWIYSWGNHTNIWGQCAATLLFAFCLTHTLSGPRTFLVALFLFLLAALAHLGVFLSLIAFLLLVALLSLGSRSSRSQVLTFAILLGTGVLLAWLLYYGEFSNVLAAQTARFIRDFSSGETAVRGTTPASLLERARHVLRLTTDQLGLVLMGLGLLGLPLAWRKLQACSRVILFAWLLVALIFTLISIGSSFSTRSTFWAAPALSISGGLVLAWLFQKTHVGALAAYALGAAAFAMTLLLWVDRVLYAYH